MCISEVIDIFPGSLDSSLSFFQSSISRKQGDNIQPWRTSFSILNQSFVPWQVLTIASWHAYRFLRRQVWWFGIPISWRIFHGSLWFTQSKSFSIVNEAEVDVFLEFSCVFMIQWMSTIWSLVLLPFLNPAWTSGSVWFTYCWSLALRILSITLLACEMSVCAVVWPFFGIVFLWGWNENWLFPVLWPLLSFPNFLAYWLQHFHSIIF